MIDRPFLGALVGGAMAVLLGIGVMLALDAPRAYVAVNSFALLAATGIAVIAYRLRSIATDRWIGLAAVAALVATLAIGPDLDGVRRWLAFGPIRLHIGMLLVPALAVAVTRIDARMAAAALCLAAIVAAIQPDLATALAVLAIALVTAALLGSIARWTAAAVAAGSTAWCLAYPDRLEPVRFVENVPGDVAAANLPLAVLLVASLILAIAMPLIARACDFPSYRASACAFVACLSGYLGASLIGAYPTPLIGAGAASILGWGLALGRLYAPVGRSASGR